MPLDPPARRPTAKPATVQPPSVEAAASQARVGTVDLGARVDALEKALAKLSDPQYLANLQEKAFSPRGQEPRIVDGAGHTLDYAGAIQFVGATATIDPSTSPPRVKVTTSGGGGGGDLQFNFSDDGSTSDDERIRGISESGGTDHYRLDSLSFGTTRAVQIAVAEDASTPANGSSTELFLADAAGIGEFVVNAVGAIVSEVVLQALDTLSAAAAATLTLSQSGGSAGATMTGSVTGAGDGTVTLTAGGNSGQSASVVARATAAAASGADVAVAVGAKGRTLLDNNGLSDFPGVRAAVGAPSRVPATLYGPFTVSPGAIGALGTASATVLGCIPVGHETTTALIGAISGAAGAELVQWSYLPDGAGNAAINFTNTSAGAITPVLALWSVADFAA